MAYKSFSVAEIGYSHKTAIKNKPLQDSAADYSDDKCSIAVISDGHGSMQYIRSDRGSNLAAETGLEILKEFAENHPEKIVSGDYEKIAEQIEKDLKSRWCQAVDEDYQREKFSDKEFLSFREDIEEYEKNHGISERLRNIYKDYKQNGKYLKAYGCTFIGVLITENYSLGVHVGDGKCVAIYPDGDSDLPIPWDEECTANITTSMCDNDFRCRVKFFEKTPMAVFVASDGIDDTFGDGDRLKDFYRKITYNICEKGEEYIDCLKNRLAEISEKGSKDDMSISGIYNISQIVKCKDILFEYIELEKDNSKIRKLENDVNNMTYESKTIKQKCDTAETQIADLEKRKQDIEKQIEILKSEKLKDDLILIDENLESAKEELETARTEKEKKFNKIKQMQKELYSVSDNEVIENISVNQGIVLENKTVIKAEQQQCSGETVLIE